MERQALAHVCWKSALEEDSSDAGRRAPVGPIAAFLATEQGRSNASKGKTAADEDHCNEDRPPSSK